MLLLDDSPHRLVQKIERNLLNAVVNEKDNNVVDGDVLKAIDE